VKKDPSGNIIKHKARLVAKRYAQTQGGGVDFDEVLAPVAKLETVKSVTCCCCTGKLGGTPYGC
jgi:hypothetical protein